MITVLRYVVIAVGVTLLAEGLRLLTLLNIRDTNVPIVGLGSVVKNRWTSTRRPSMAISSRCYDNARAYWEEVYKDCYKELEVKDKETRGCSIPIVEYVEEREVPTALGSTVIYAHKKEVLAEDIPFNYRQAAYPPGGSCDGSQQTTEVQAALNRQADAIKTLGDKVNKPKMYYAHFPPDYK
jgi:hypothetical protein